MTKDKAKILLEIEQALLEKIEDFRFNNRIPSRAEAVRELLRKGLKSTEKKSKDPKT